MSTVTIAFDVLDPESWTTHNDVALMEVLREHFERFPDTGRIYLNYVAQTCDVTPHSEAEVEALLQMEGHFYIMVYPKGFEVIAIIIAIVLAAVAIGLTFLLRPSTNKANQQQSPNNRISNRTNTSRPTERIPDIFGTVRSVPDLIAPDYNIFEGNQEVQYSYSCVGRGQYQIEQTLSTSIYNPTPVWDIKEDVTPVQEIAGESVEVYGPNSSPNAPLFPLVTQPGPTLTLGAAIATPIYNAQPSNCVNGQILRPPNDQSVTGNSNMRATASGTIECNDTSVDFTAYFADGDGITLEFTTTDPGGVHASYDLGGSYVALTVTSNIITFVNPNTVNPNWSNLASYTTAASEYADPKLSSSGPKWVGPFILNGAQIAEVWCNFVAPNGLFKVSSSSGNQYEINCNITVGIQAIDGNNQPVGSEVFFHATVYGSAVLQSQRGTTLKCVLPLAGSCRIRVTRSNFTDNTWQGTNADQTQWRDLYAVSYPTEAHYGDVTTVMTKTYATASALTVKERKLNMLVTRMVPTKANWTDLKPTPSNLNASTNIADIVCAMAKDRFIGNRTDAEIDYAGIYATLGPASMSGTKCAVEDYFDTDLCTQFGYTFDDSNTSFEEMLGDVAQTCFCQFYRQGSLLTVYFEKLTDVPTLLFNHRNKLPRSETRTVTFGYVNDYDGIELDYIDPNAPNYPDIDTTVTLYYPTDQSALNAKKVTLVGVRNNVQAALIGWRLYQKLLFQNTITKFNATKEATLLVLTNKIIVADSTRDDVMDGQIAAVNALELTLSQPTDLLVGKAYSIFLQHPDATVEAIPITAGSAPNKVILSAAPDQPIIVDPASWVQATTYLISLPDSDAAAPRTSAFLVTEKKYNDNQTFALTAANYDDRYYAHDQDFATGALTFNGTSYAGNGGYAASGFTGGGGSAATFDVITETITTNPLPLPNPTYQVDSIAILTGGSGYPPTVMGQLIGYVYDEITAALVYTVDPVLLGVDGSGAITYTSDSTPDLNWSAVPSFSIA